MITLGIDIGGSATKGALVDTVSGRMVSDRIRFETEAPVKPREVAALVEKPAIPGRFGCKLAL